MSGKRKYVLIKYQNRLLALFFILSFSSCMKQYVDWEQKSINERGYERSEVLIKGMVEKYIDNKFLLYEFKVGDSLVKQEALLGQNVNTEIVRFYYGSRYEIIYNPKDLERNLLLFNKPIFKESQQFKSSNAEIISISRNDYLNVWFGFLQINCRYWVNGKDYIHWGGISKDLFFPDKDYNEITRKELRQLKRKYKGKKCIIEYDIENPGVSRLIESSIVSNE